VWAPAAAAKTAKSAQTSVASLKQVAIR
jgi:hypothetical protein